MIADRRQDVEVVRYDSESGLEPNLIIASAGTTVRHDADAQFRRGRRQDLRLQAAFSRNAQRIGSAATYVARDEPLEHAFEQHASSVDAKVLLRAKAERTCFEF